MVHLRKFVVFKKVRITLLTLVALRNYPPPDLLLLCVSGGSKSVEYSQKTMEDALKKVEELGADLGGTEILEPLRHIYSQTCIPNHPRQVTHTYTQQVTQGGKESIFLCNFCN